MHTDIQTTSHPALNFHQDRVSWRGGKPGKAQVYSSPISEPLKDLKHLLSKKWRMKEETDKVDRTKSFKNREKTQDILTTNCMVKEVEKQLPIAFNLL